MAWSSSTPLGKVGLLCLADASPAKRVRGLGTGVDIGVVAPELSCFECHLFLLGRKSHRLVWFSALGPVCCVSGFRFSTVCAISGPVWMLERRLHCSEYRPFLLEWNCRRLVWSVAFKPVCAIGLCQASCTSQHNQKSKLMERASTIHLYTSTPPLTCDGRRESQHVDTDRRRESQHVNTKGGNNNFTINCENQDSNSRPGL
jgi:hypothetical protein